MIAISSYSQHFIIYRTTIAKNVNGKYVWQPSKEVEMTIDLVDNILYVSDKAHSTYRMPHNAKIKKLDGGTAFMFTAYDEDNVKCRADMVLWDDKSVQFYVIYKGFQVVYDVLKSVQPRE